MGGSVMDPEPIPSRFHGVFVLTGCSQSKKQTDEPISACELYDSVYWDKKRELSDAIVEWSDPPTAAWNILSAEHGVLPPMREIEAYDTSIEDLRGEPLGWDSPHILPNGTRVTTKLDWWAHCVRGRLIDWLRAPFRADQYAERRTPCGELVILLGERYLDPLRERGVFTGIPESIHTDGLAGKHTIEGLTRVRYAFQEHDFSGNGKQMHWMKQRAEELRSHHDCGQDDLGSVGAGYVRERPLWQLGRPDIDVEGTEQADLFAFEDPPDAYIATAQQCLSDYGGGNENRPEENEREPLCRRSN